MNRVTTAIARRLSIHKCLLMRSRLKNSGFSIISQNYVGGTCTTTLDFVS